MFLAGGLFHFKNLKGHCSTSRMERYANIVCRARVHPRVYSSQRKVACGDCIPVSLQSLSSLIPPATVFQSAQPAATVFQSACDLCHLWFTRDCIPVSARLPAATVFQSACDLCHLWFTRDCIPVSARLPAATVFQSACNLCHL